MNETARTTDASEAATEVAKPSVSLAPGAVRPALARAVLGSADAATRARVLLRMQRTHGNAAVGKLMRKVTYDDCNTSQKTDIGAGHIRAKQMMQTAIDKLKAYDGTNPPEVKKALKRNFNSESTKVAWIVNNHLKAVIKQVDDTQYECHTEANGSAEAEALWCIPWSDIKVYPLWYTKSDGTPQTPDYRASTLAHEWMHRYDCRLDVGYEWEKDYPGHGTIRQLMNADSFGTLVYEVRDPPPAATP